MVSVIFPAAGQGKRMQSTTNKVLMELLGTPILIRTLRKFSEAPSVDQLIVVAAAEEVPFIRSMLSKIPGLKPWTVTTGGSERQYSVQNGMACLDASTDVVLVHDAARPLISVETIEDVIKCAAENGGGVAAVKAKNTVKLVGEDNVIKSTPKRDEVWEIQTPQGFKREILEEAFEKAGQEGFLGTDDASLVERLGKPVSVVESSYRNIKITTPEDMVIAVAFIKDDEVQKLKKNVKGVIHTVSDEIGHHIFRKDRKGE